MSELTPEEQKALRELEMDAESGDAEIGGLVEGGTDPIAEAQEELERTTRERAVRDEAFGQLDEP